MVRRMTRQLRRDTRTAKGGHEAGLASVRLDARAARRLTVGLVRQKYDIGDRSVLQDGEENDHHTTRGALA